MREVTEGTTFCEHCGKETTYQAIYVRATRTYGSKPHSFRIREASCRDCGAKVYYPGLLEENSKAMDAQYRKVEGIVSVEEINRKVRLCGSIEEFANRAGICVDAAKYFAAGQMPDRLTSDRIKNMFRGESE